MSYPHDSLLTIEYPFKMAVSFEMVPHPLLNTERALQVRRRVILPDNVTHTAVWRYYGYDDAAGSPAAAAQNVRALRPAVTLSLIHISEPTRPY